METEQQTADDYVSGGYIILARRMFEPDSFMMDKPPLYFKLWVWLLSKANWQDRDKLKKGQLFTTIEMMQEATSHHVGYRKSTPTKDAIRTAYGALAKADMIATTTTTRGMVITIQNYERYQNPRSYQAHG